MLPREAERGKNYNVTIDELDQQIATCKAKNSLVQGRLHWNKKRVSIIYSTGGIFTFSLEEKQDYTQPSIF